MGNKSLMAVLLFLLSFGCYFGQIDNREYIIFRIDSVSFNPNIVYLLLDNETITLKYLITHNDSSNLYNDSDIFEKSKDLTCYKILLEELQEKPIILKYKLTSAAEISICYRPQEFFTLRIQLKSNYINLRMLKASISESKRNRSVYYFPCFFGENQRYKPLSNNAKPKENYFNI